MYSVHITEAAELKFIYRPDNAYVPHHQVSSPAAVPAVAGDGFVNRVVVEDVVIIR
jgi:hypothetical protein